MTTGRINQVAFLTDVEVLGHEASAPPTVVRKSSLMWRTRVETPCQQHFPNPSERAKKRGPRQLTSGTKASRITSPTSKIASDTNRGGHGSIGVLFFIEYRLLGMQNRKSIATAKAR